MRKINWYNSLSKTASYVFSKISFSLIISLVISTGIFEIIIYLLSDIINDNVINILSIYSYYILGVPIFLFMTHRLPKYLEDKSKFSLTDFFNLLCLSVLFLYVGSIAGSAFISLIEKISKQSQSAIVESSLGNIPIYIEFPAVVIIGPFCEEYIFRKRIIDTTRIYGSKLSILFSSVLFGLFHGNFEQMFYAAFIGLIFSFIYLKYNDIRYTFILHAIINFFGSYFIIWIFNGYNLNYSSLISDLSEFKNPRFLLIILFYLIVLIFFVRGFFILNKRISTNIDFKLNSLDNKVSFKTAFLNFGTILFVVFCLTEAIFILMFY